MYPTTLYVIGNGFDLWHDIPSSLGRFKEYVFFKDRSIHREVEDHLPAGEDWCDLELALAELDADMLVDNLGHFMASYGADAWSDAGHHDFQYEVSKINVSTSNSRGSVQTRRGSRSKPLPTR